MSRSFIGILLMLVSLPFVSGCAVALVGGVAAGTVAYINGDLQSDLDATLPRTMEATGHALERLKFIKGSEKGDAVTGEITARTAQDKSIVVKFSRLTKDKTRVSIRVGVFGDERVSNILLDEIKKGL